jgi:hypothetical protein
MTSPPSVPPSPIAVLICDDTTQICQASRCQQPADLLIAMSDDTADPPELWCADHWAAVRSLFVEAGRVIHYGEGAPERIVERLGIRIGGGEHER